MSNGINSKEGLAAFALIAIAIAAVIWISFKLSKLVYQYSRSRALSVWTFIVTVLCLISTVGILEHGGGVFVIPLYAAAFGPIAFVVRKLYLLKKPEIDHLIEEEEAVESNASNGIGMAGNLLISAGGVYAGYKLGKSTKI